jgi:hypothetical protein
VAYILIGKAGRKASEREVKREEGRDRSINR